MISDEALSIPEPRSMLKRFKDIKKLLRNYYLVIWVLFVVAMALCVNNYVVFKTYKDLQKDSDDAIKKAKTMMADNRNLSIEREELKKENDTLKQKCNEIINNNGQILSQVEAIKNQNDELMKKNKELIDDNIALQNSLKAAASAGIKPQNFTNFNGISARGDLVRGTYIGKFLGTAYTPSTEECGSNKGITNSGKPVIPGISVAIDNKYWPFGTVFYIRGLGYAVAMDTGGAIKGKKRFDFAVFDKKFAESLGAKYWDVYVVRLGEGRVGEVKF